LLISSSEKTVCQQLILFKRNSNQAAPHDLRLFQFQTNNNLKPTSSMMSFFLNGDDKENISNDDNKENIAPIRRKKVASSILSPVEKRLKKSATDSKLIRQAKTLFSDMAASDSIIATVEAIFNDVDNKHGMIQVMRSTIMQQVKIRFDTNLTSADCETIRAVDTNYREKMYKAITEIDSSFINHVNFGDCPDENATDLITLNFATDKETERPAVGRGLFNLMNSSVGGCIMMMDVCVVKRYFNLKLEEAGIEGKARKDLRIDGLRFNDGITFAFDVPANYNTKLDGIRKSLKLQNVDEIHLISVVLRISHALHHRAKYGTPLNTVCCSSPIFEAQFGLDKQNGCRRYLVDLKGQGRHPEWLMCGYAAAFTAEELAPCNAAICDFLASIKQMKAELLKVGVDLDIHNKHVGISQSFSIWNNLTEEERETIRCLKHEGNKLGGERSGMEHHIASKVEVDCLNEATTLEDLQLSDDLFDIATALCLVVHNGRVDKMLDVLRSFKKGHILTSLISTTAAAYDLDFLQKAKSVNELTGLKDEDKAILLKHGH